MEKLNEQWIYACSLPMHDTDHPKCDEWVYEIERQVENNKQDEIYLAGHSFGVRAILRYLEETIVPISGAVLISGRVDESPNVEVASFGGKPFNFKKIKKNCKSFAVIHGDNDSFVPVENASILGKQLGCEPLIIKNGGHFDREAGYLTFPECLGALQEMFN